MSRTLIPWFIELKEYLRIGNKKVYYSQFGEDVFLRSFFRGKKSAGFYVDVGANHPMRCSNTYLLYKNGWRGINIEPDRVSYQLLTWFRGRDTNIRCGIGRGETGTFYRSKDPRQGTFRKEVASRNQSRGISLVHEETIQMRELSDILREHRVTAIDVLSIDTEGYDLEVLETLDFDAVRPTIIIAEEHDFDISKAETSPIFSYLSSKGYRLICRLGYSLIFMDAH